jgi:hypothetical protein
MTAVNLHNQEWTKQNFEDYIVPKYINVPNTAIVNRAQVLDGSNILSALMGVVRVPFKGIKLLNKEFGASGEQVYELESKDSRVRFVGTGWAQLSDITYGNRVRSLLTNDYIEMTFYGTGLNILCLMDNSTNPDWRVSIDGGAEGSNIYIISSAVISNRSYNQNCVLNVANGLSLGWHTIKIRGNTSASSNGLALFGMEVLNISSSVSITPGQAMMGNKKDALAVLSNSAYNEGVTGTKGARVIKYLKGGSIYSAVRECASAPSYLTNANHADEEIVRKINFREFGANRGDDFTTFTAESTKAFTLDDGTTNLMGSVVSADAQGMWPSNVGYYEFTFVGTGLDIVIDNTTSSPGGSAWPLWVDGIQVGTVLGTTSSKVTLKLCSGLSYGTHVVRISRSAVGDFQFRTQDFIIYQPKMPLIPGDAVVLADYNILANYISNTLSLNQAISKGVLRKQVAREMTYVGTGWSIVAVAATIGGFETITLTTGDYIEYSFFGTGVEWRFESGTVTSTSTISIDGSSNLSGYATSYYGAGISSFVPSTGVYTNSTTNTVNGISIQSLPLGWHKIRVTRTSGTGNCWHQAFDITTPIHVNHNSLKIGNLSLFDNSKIGAIKNSVNSSVDLGKAKAWLVYDQLNNKVLDSYGIAQVLPASTGFFYVFFAKPFKNNNYLTIANIGRSDGSAAADVGGITPQRVTPSSILFYSVQISAPTANSNYSCMAFFGEQQDEI